MKRTVTLINQTFPGSRQFARHAGEGLVKLITRNDMPGHWAGVWRSGTFPESLQVGECTTGQKHWPWNNWALDIRQSWWRFLGSESCFTAVEKECATPPLFPPRPGTSLHMTQFYQAFPCKWPTLGWEGLGTRLASLKPPDGTTHALHGAVSLYGDNFHSLLKFLVCVGMVGSICYYDNVYIMIIIFHDELLIIIITSQVIDWGNPLITWSNNSQKSCLLASHMEDPWMYADISPINCYHNGSIRPCSVKTCWL